MIKKVNLFLFGKKYRVPANLTIMNAMEYAGYQLVKGCGCRNGFCGSCAVIYRIIDEPHLKTALACQTLVENNMYIAVFPSFPFIKKTHNIKKIPLYMSIMQQLYPEIFSCIKCNLCSKNCPQKINVMKYISYAQDGDFKNCAIESFECIMCGICSANCPANILQPQVAMLARRINGKYLTEQSKHLDKRIKEINSGKFINNLEGLIKMSDDKIKELYNTRDIEK